MIYIVCSVRDQKSEAFGRPFFVPSVGVAMRDFEDEVNRADEKNILYRHPSDFALYQLGVFDDADGKIATDLPRLLVIGDQVRKDGGNA